MADHKPPIDPDHRPPKGPPPKGEPPEENRKKKKHHKHRFLGGVLKLVIFLLIIAILLIILLRLLPGFGGFGIPGGGSPGSSNTSEPAGDNSASPTVAPTAEPTEEPSDAPGTPDTNAKSYIVRIDGETVTVDGKECADAEALKEAVLELYEDDAEFRLEDNDSILATHDWVIQAFEDMSIPLIVEE